MEKTQIVVMVVGLIYLVVVGVFLHSNISLENGCFTHRPAEELGKGCIWVREWVKSKTEHL